MVAQRQESTQYPLDPQMIRASWLNVGQVVSLYKISSNTIYHWLGAGKLEGVRLPLVGAPRQGTLPCWHLDPLHVEDKLRSFRRNTLAPPPASRTPPARDPSLPRPPKMGVSRQRAGYLPALLCPESMPLYPKRALLIAKMVANVYGMSLEDLLSRPRLPANVDARRVLLVLLTEMPALYGAHGYATEYPWILEDLSRMVGRDHSTCLHHLGRITRAPSWEETEMLAQCRLALHRHIGGMAGRVAAKRARS